LALALEQRLFRSGGSPILLDGDTMRAGLNGDLGFAPEDRRENVRRLAEVANHLAQNGHIAIVAAVSPFLKDRAEARRIARENFREIYVSTPSEICESRDPKGHYAKARAGEIKGFTGITGDYQAPDQVELKIDTSGSEVSASAEQIEEMLRLTGILLEGAA
jgi:bifunctional enzyme CysN/CysC